MDRREAIQVIKDVIGQEVECNYDSVMIEALNVAVGIMTRAVPCKECAWGRFKEYMISECPYFCMIGQHYHAPDFFCRNGKPKVDET